MKNKPKKILTHEQKEAKATRAKLLERESNITLVSVSVAIVSFLMMLYVQNAVTVDYLDVGQPLLAVLRIVLLVASVGTAAVAIWKKKFYLFEYTVFTFILALGYHILKEGPVGIPFLYNDAGDNLAPNALGRVLEPYLKNNYVLYGLWGVNVLYCVYAIVVHSIRYTRIKKIKASDVNAQGKKA
ncbi:MAG: hypothetical protein II998_08700 [Clostridia bacterium]|nr:hypothetical protein [Clostridia bacterium]